MNLLTKNTTTSGYNTIVADAADAKDAVQDHPIGENTTTIRKQNRRTMVLVIGGSVSTFVVGMLLFCATQASSSLPLSTPSLSSAFPSLRTTALVDPSRQDDDKKVERCYIHTGDTCGKIWFSMGYGCCGSTSCVSNVSGRTGDACYGYTDSCICVVNPTPAPTLSPYEYEYKYRFE